MRASSSLVLAWLGLFAACGGGRSGASDALGSDTADAAAIVDAASDASATDATPDSVGDVVAPDDATLVDTTADTSDDAPDPADAAADALPDVTDDGPSDTTDDALSDATDDALPDVTDDVVTAELPPRCEAGLPTPVLAPGETCAACFARLAECCYGDPTIGGEIALLTARCEARPECRRGCDECAAATCESLRAYTCPYVAP